MLEQEEYKILRVIYKNWEKVKIDWEKVYRGSVEGHFLLMHEDDLSMPDQQEIDDLCLDGYSADELHQIIRMIKKTFFDLVPPCGGIATWSVNHLKECKEFSEPSQEGISSDDKVKRQEVLKVHLIK